MKITLRPILTAALWLTAALSLRGQITLDYCLERARDNYPLIKKYDLTGQTEAIALEEINRGWLPRVGVFAQATAQSAVSAFPAPLKGMLDMAGASMAGMSRLQYKAGLELNQTIWDGGASQAQRAVSRASTARAEAALEVELYAIRERVESIFFGILLLDEQMAQVKSTISLLKSNLERMRAMVASGTAMQSDADMVEAQLLTLSQQLTEAESSASAYRRMLSLYIGEDAGRRELLRPEAEEPADLSASHRPELTLFDSRLGLNAEQARAGDAALRPRIGFFAQAWYGYPGLNMFESIMSRRPSLNALGGLKIAWSIDPLYTHRSSQRRLALEADMIRADRELFIFNTGLKSTQEQGHIEGLRRVTAEDDRIVELRANVRRAAESQLSHGIIDANALLTKITDENQALLNQSLHRIQLLQTIYQLKNTLNR